MEMNRREATIAIGVVAVSAACGGSSPTAPDVPNQQPPAGTNPNSQNPTSLYGTFYKQGTAAVDGTLEKVLRADGLNPEVSNTGLLERFNNRYPPTLRFSEDKPVRGYVFYVRGSFFGNSVKEIKLKTGETWVAFDWNGKNPAEMQAAADAIKAKEVIV